MFKLECDFVKWAPSAEENVYTLKFTTQEIPDDMLLLIKAHKAHKGRHGYLTFGENLDNSQ